jgi:hypothetical protein
MGRSPLKERPVPVVCGSGTPRVVQAACAKGQKMSGFSLSVLGWFSLILLMQRNLFGVGCVWLLLKVWCFEMGLSYEVQCYLQLIILPSAGIIAVYHHT